ncbi:unnamed protein product, partial [marine sediment metagenome]
EYRDFWHWIIDGNDVHNGGTIWIDPIETIESYGD